MVSSKNLKILFVEDVPSDVELAILELKKENLVFDYRTVCSRTDLETALKEFKPDLVISDYLMPSFNGLQALAVVKEYNNFIPFILFTGSVNEETAVECIKAGAEDYIIKEHMTRLPFVVKETLDQVEAKKEKRASELLLIENEEKLQSIIRAAPVGIGMVSNRIIVEVNDALCNMIGFERSDLIGKSSEIFYPTKEEYDIVGREKYQQIDEKGIGSVETRFKRKDGTIINIVLSSAPLDTSNYLKGVTFTALDITLKKQADMALKASEERFRSIAENLKDVIFLADKEGMIRYISPASRLFDYSPEECIGKNFVDFLADGEKEKAMPVFINALNSVNISENVSLVFKKKDGSPFIAELSGSPYKFENETIGVLGLLRDVTDKMYKEIELRKLSRAVNQSPVSIVITDLYGNIEYVNPKLCEITGYSKEELLGKNPRVLSSGEKTPQEYRQFWDTINAGNEWRGEFHNRKKNGDLYWESASVSSIKNERDEITHFIGIKEDITSRKNLEAATLESEKRYRELFINNPVPTYIFDVDSLGFIEVNDATVQSYGYSHKEFSRMTLKDLRLPEDIPDLIKSIKGLGNETFQSDTMRHVRKNGILFPVEIISHSLPEKNGRKTRLVMATDITEREKANEQMRLAKEKAEASDMMKTTFLNNISHEVRTPLNGILGFAEIISQTGLSENDKRDSIAMLHESSERLLNTITNYMDVSLLTSGNLSVKKKDFIPGKIISELYESYLPSCINKNLNLIVDVPEKSESLLLYSDPELFRKIFAHLLNNAVKFTDTGSIRFGLFVNKSEIDFFVVDTGIGIGYRSIDTIFERFVKEDHGPLRLSEGSGLGLSIAKGLTECLGGNIRVESVPGVGSNFIFSIPFTNGYAETFQSEGGGERSDTGRKRGKSKTILVAEDDATNFYYLNALINRETDLKVIHANNGREALELFKANPEISLILMDMKMPELDGFEATRQIKLENKDIPIIAITAYAMSGDEDKVIDAGCDAYLSKPITKINLLGKMAEFITF